MKRGGRCRFRAKKHLHFTRMGAQPGFEPREFEGPGVEIVADECEGGVGVRRYAPPVDREKRIGRGKTDALVAIDEDMVPGQAFPESCRFRDQVSVIAGLRSKQGRFQQSGISQPMRAAITLDLVGMDCKNLNTGQVVRHSASFL